MLLSENWAGCQAAELKGKTIIKSFQGLFCFAVVEPLSLCLSRFGHWVRWVQTPTWAQRSASTCSWSWWMASSCTRSWPRCEYLCRSVPVCLLCFWTVCLSGNWVNPVFPVQVCVSLNVRPHPDSLVSGRKRHSQMCQWNAADSEKEIRQSDWGLARNFASHFIRPEKLLSNSGKELANLKPTGVISSDTTKVWQYFDANILCIISRFRVIIW